MLYIPSGFRHIIGFSSSHNVPMLMLFHINLQNAICKYPCVQVGSPESTPFLEESTKAVKDLVLGWRNCLGGDGVAC